MRKITLLALLLLCAVCSCKRRPLTTADYTVLVNIEIEKEIVNYVMEQEPSMMRCIFYDHESGAFVTQAFLPAWGGEVSVMPSRTYDILVYNFGTESTWIKDENWFNKIFASTSVIPDSFKSKLRSRASTDDKEDIVYDPDHLYVARKDSVFIPSRAVEAPITVINMYAQTVVETWLVDVRTVTGKENIGSIAAVVTGLAEYNKIAIPQRSTEYVSVYFDNPVIDENGVLTAKFNTFGYHPQSGTTQILSLVFTDIAGKGHVFDFDVSNQFTNNKEQIIRIVTQIDIPKPMTGGDGGFVPKVDEWEDINTEIVI